MKRITMNGCLFALAVTAAASAQTMSLVPRGGTGNSIAVAPCATVTIDVYAQGIAPDLLRAYQATLPLTATGGASGSVGHDGAVPMINSGHPDYVFAALTASGTGSVDGLPLVVNALQFAGDSVSVTTSMYLGEFQYEVSTNASGSFTIDAVDPGTNPSVNDSFLVDRFDQPIAFTTIPAQITACNDLDVCTWDVPAGSSCTNTPNAYGDVNHTGIPVDIFDILCVLDGFAGVYTTCPCLDTDIAGCPGGDGIIDIFDILAVLDAFAGVSACSCPG
ncbi:MAG: hypothetical protein HOP29_12255 [Phycisphaerales bacterium]|nr:hypothetical protein [Phycisphaerales bacterium]